MLYPESESVQSTEQNSVWLPVCKPAAVCVSEVSVFAGSTALDLQSMNRSRLCGGRLVKSPSCPKLRNSGGGLRSEEALESPTLLEVPLSILFKSVLRWQAVHSDNYQTELAKEYAAYGEKFLRKVKSNSCNGKKL